MALLSRYSMVDPRTRSLPGSLPERCREYRKAPGERPRGIVPQRVHGLQRRVIGFFRALEIYRDGVEDFQRPSLRQFPLPLSTCCRAPGREDGGGERH